ncbi:MAG TPA: phosphatase PAP2 family protein [Gaiellales bacterium]
MRLRVGLIGALVAAAVALGYGVNAGWTHTADVFAAHDLMPWRACPYHPQSSVDQLIAPLPAAFCHSPQPLYAPPATGRVAFAVASTAAPAMAMVAVAILACLAPRRRRLRTLIVGLAALGAASVGEVVGKLAVTRPPILRLTHAHQVAVSMTHSFPCGHTIRGCIVVYLVIALRRSWAAAAFVWFAAVQVALVSTSGHTLTDLGGGLLLGLVIAAVMARALRHTPEPARVSAPSALPAAGETVV